MAAVREAHDVKRAKGWLCLICLIEEAQDLASHFLPTGLLVVHDP